MWQPCTPALRSQAARLLRCPLQELLRLEVNELKKELDSLEEELARARDEAGEALAKVGCCWRLGPGTWCPALPRRRA